MRRHTPLLPSPTPQGPPAATLPPDAPAELTDATLLACHRLLAAPPEPHAAREADPQTEGAERPGLRPVWGQHG